MKKYMQAFNHFVSEENQNVISKAENLTQVNRVWKLLQNGDDFGIISAFNPVAGADTNRKRREELEQELLRMKYGYIAFTTGYLYIDDDGLNRIEHELLFVPLITKDEIQGLGVKYDQQTVIFGNKDGVDSFDIPSFKEDISLNFGDMVFGWCSLLFAQGTFRIPNNPNSLPAQNRQPTEHCMVSR